MKFPEPDGATTIGVSKRVYALSHRKTELILKDRESWNMHV